MTPDLTQDLITLAANFLVLAVAIAGTWVVVRLYKLAWIAVPRTWTFVKRAGCSLRDALRSILPPRRSQGIFKRRSSLDSTDTAPAEPAYAFGGEFELAGSHGSRRASAALTKQDGAGDHFTFDWNFPERTVR
jgi:hypothetical protein